MRPKFKPPLSRLKPLARPTLVMQGPVVGHAAAGVEYRELVLDLPKGLGLRRVMVRVDADVTVDGRRALLGDVRPGMFVVIPDYAEPHVAPCHTVVAAKSPEMYARF